MEIEVRITLERLHVVRKNEDADEPFLWVFFLKFDSTTASISAPDTASILLVAPSGAHHNLGEPSEGVTSGQSIPIPANIGRWTTKLSAFEVPLNLAQFATLALVVAGLEEDQTSDSQALDLHGRVVEDARKNLNEIVRDVIREIKEAWARGEAGPGADEVEARLRQMGDTKRVIDEMIADYMPVAIVSSIGLGIGIQAADPDDQVGINIPDPLWFPKLLAQSLRGIELDLDLSMDRRLSQMFADRGIVGVPDSAPDRVVQSEAGKYRVTGRVERLDIQEPPTLGAVRLAGNKLSVFGRSTGGSVYVHHSENRGGSWSFSKQVGSQAHSSGPAAAASNDGSRFYLAARAADHRMAVCLPDGDGLGETWRKLFDREFQSGAGIATSADGQTVWVGATGKGGHLFLTCSLNGGANWAGGATGPVNKFVGRWDVIDEREFRASPALACSDDGRRLHIVTLNPDGRLRFASTADAGESWTARFMSTLGGGFVSAPACATSADGRIVLVAARRDDGRFYIRRLTNFGAAVVGDWRPLPGSFVSAPALVCSETGTEVHVFGIANDLTLRYRFSPDAGLNWTQRWRDVNNQVAWF